MHRPTKAQSVSTWVLVGCGVWFIAPGLEFAASRPPLLPEDPRFMGNTLAQIRAEMPDFEL